MSVLALESWIQTSVKHAVQQHLALFVGHFVFDTVQRNSKAGDIVD
jgi:hypothetical protein